MCIRDRTETVYQIARATGRDILRVDVDKIKSCWVGESEQNIKKLFDRYRNICKDSTLAPILLLDVYKRQCVFLQLNHN